MAKFTSLATEILAHMHTLSIEDGDPLERQRARHNDIRSLVLVADHERCGKVFENILPSLPHLVDCDLDLLFDDPKSGSESPLKTLASLEGVLGSLVDLEVLRIDSRSIYPPVLLRIRLPLRSLKLLEVPLDIGSLGRPHDKEIEQLCLSNLHTLRVALNYHEVRPFGNRILGAVGTKLQVLDLGRTGYYVMSRKSVLPILSSVPNMVHLTWAPRPEPLEQGTRDAVLALLGAMKKLESVSMSAWLVSHSFGAMRNVPPHELPLDHPHELPLDHQLLDTFATLPRLRSVQLYMTDGRLDETHLLHYLKAHTPLRSLTIHHETSSRDGGTGWTQEHRERVAAAAAKAGVVFEYKHILARW